MTGTHTSQHVSVYDITTDSVKGGAEVWGCVYTYAMYVVCRVLICTAFSPKPFDVYTHSVLTVQQYIATQ